MAAAGALTLQNQMMKNCSPRRPPLSTIQSIWNHSPQALFPLHTAPPHCFPQTPQCIFAHTGTSFYEQGVIQLTECLRRLDSNEIGVDSRDWCLHLKCCADGLVHVWANQRTYRFCPLDGRISFCCCCSIVSFLVETTAWTHHWVRRDYLHQTGTLTSRPAQKRRGGDSPMTDEWERYNNHHDMESLSSYPASTWRRKRCSRQSVSGQSGKHA